MKTEVKMKTENKNYVVYFRVSTSKQGQSGLGLDAQKTAVENFISGNSGSVVKEFVEIESGKKSNRPILNQAIQLCKENGFILCVAKLDRLARNVHFITTLQHSKIDFVAVDNPHATPFLIHIISAVAEHEATMISTRTKQALAEAKARGTTLGNPRFTDALTKANEVRSATAKERNGKLRQIVEEIKAKTGIQKLAEIAEVLNLRGIKTARGNQWTPSHVFNLLNA